MIAGSKRSSEEADLKQPVSKRKRNEPSLSSGILSSFDRSIERFGHWLRSLFGRREHPVEKATTALIANDMESPETSDTMPLPINDFELHENKLQLQSSSSAMANEEIETKQTELQINRPSVTSSTRATPTTASTGTSSTGAGTRTSSVSIGESTVSKQLRMPYSSLTRPTSSNPVHKNDQNYTTQNKKGRRQYVMSPVLDSVMNEREDAMFQELIQSHNIQPSSGSLPENIGPTSNKGRRDFPRLPTTSTPAVTTSLPAPKIKLYSVGYNNSIYPPRRRPLTREYLFSQKEVLLQPPLHRDPSQSLNNVTFPPRTQFSSSFGWTPSLIKHTSSNVPVPGSLHVLSPEGTVPLKDKHSSHQTQPSATIHESQTIASPVNGLSSRSSSSSLFDWLTHLKHNFSLNTADHEAKLEVAKKYAKIHQEQRIIADDTRAQKLAEMMTNMKVRPWTPQIEEEPDELNLYLDEDIHHLVDDAWRHGYPDQVFAEGYSIKVKRSDLQTLKGNEWLNDEVINFYLNLIVDTVNSQGKRKVHLFNSFFYPKIMSSGYSGVRRWTKKIDLFTYDLVLLPVHLGMHWCLAVIDFTRKQISYYDSLRGKNTKCLTVLRSERTPQHDRYSSFFIRDYLVSEAQDKKQITYDVSDWSLECCQDIPEQHNGSDCGVFTCMYARHLVRDKTFRFSQEDMQTIRRLMVAEIIFKKLM